MQACIMQAYIMQACIIIWFHWIFLTPRLQILLLDSNFFSQVFELAEHLNSEYAEQAEQAEHAEHAKHAEYLTMLDLLNSEHAEHDENLNSEHAV